MRTIETKVYAFSELNDAVKKIAISEIENKYNEYNDFSEWAIDDCYLLQPIELINEELLIVNNRKIYFSLGYNRYIDISNAMEIQNSTLFLKWLGLDKRLINKVDYKICLDHLEFMNQSKNDFTAIQQTKLNAAGKKFRDHCQDILRRIETGIEYRFTDESIIEDIEANEYEFTADGKIY